VDPADGLISGAVGLDPNAISLNPLDHGYDIYAKTSGFDQFGLSIGAGSKVVSEAFERDNPAPGPC
jgi:hypothetical protein